MFLYINTTDHQNISLGLFEKRGEFKFLKKIKSKYQQSEKLLHEIEKILAIGKKDLKKIKGVLVVIGPGGFTSLRIGVAVANSLAWSLSLPIVGVENKKSLADEDLVKKGVDKLVKLKKFKQVLPVYGKEPNIG